MLLRSRFASSLLVASLVPFAACMQGEPVVDSPAETADAQAPPPALSVNEEGWMRAGSEFTTGDLTAVTPAELFGDPEAFDGQPVLVEGTIKQVCQASGCWFSFQQEGEDLYVFLEDAEGEMFYVPKDIAGRQVRLLGTFSAESDAGKHELVADSVEIAQN